MTQSDATRLAGSSASGGASPVWPGWSAPWRRKPTLNVIAFSGGRGSSVLSKELIANPGIVLTIAINGYDDGASTGEVRRFLGDSLGPSDFRKNASRLARELRTCDPALVDLLDARFPVGATDADAERAFGAIARRTSAADAFTSEVGALSARLEPPVAERLARALGAFERERQQGARPFDFSDCSVGNLVFAGIYLERGRDFNAAVADYCAFVGLPDGCIENVTDGTNAFLVALDLDGRVLGSEGEIVDAKRRNRIRDIYLIDRPITTEDRTWLETAAPSEAVELLERRRPPVSVNPRLVERIAEADLIIYSPGTQHSSLFPSYLTPGLSEAIARNLTAIKLLITNIQSDAEIAGSSAVDIVGRAVYYLKEKGRLSLPTPCLITHFLINDPGSTESAAPYVPLGPVDAFEDPRLVRIGNYEAGVTGRHDASKILGPFLRSFGARRSAPKVAVLLYDADSPEKLSQTILEMVRGGVQDLPLDVSVFYASDAPLEPGFTRLLPFAARQLGGPDELRRLVRDEGFDYVVLFESSGMYRGEDIVGLASPLSFGRLDAVWGSRRLSVKDIEESYRLRYRHNVLLGSISYVGSHLLSVLYLLLYGRYVSDTLSGARAVRAAYLEEAAIDLTDRQANQRLLSMLLRHKADLLEAPVQFFALSPERVRRTSVLDGLQALGTILWWRLSWQGRRARPRTAAAGGQAVGSEVKAVEEHLES